MIDILRSISIILGLIYIGFSYAAINGTKNIGVMLIAVGRIGVVTAIVASLSSELGGLDHTASYIFNLIFIPSVIISMAGMSMTYRRERNHD